MFIKATTSKKFKKNFKRFAQEVTTRDSAVIINRKSQPNVVLISEAAFADWQASQLAMRVPDNHDALQQSIDELTNSAQVPEPTANLDDMVQQTPSEN